MSAPERGAADLIEVSIPDDPFLETGVSAALMRQVARGELPTTIRLNRMAPILAFGRLDRLRPGYTTAVRIAREHGYTPLERLAGGRAAVFHEGTLSLSRAVRSSGPAGSYRSTPRRFAEMASTISDAIAALGVDARIGEVAGEYCPGAFSINARGASKLAGIGQRVIVGGAHCGAVVVVRGAGRIRQVLEPVYEALELDWNPETTGSIALELGEDDSAVPLDVDDPLIDRVAASIRQALERDTVLKPVAIAGSTMRFGGDLAASFRPRTLES